jgi:tetratricopeptide (TPR) repeat protein
MKVGTAFELVLVAALVTATCAGCGSYVKRGTTLYTDGRYVEAAEVFEQSEYRLRDSSAREQAEYGLYRGLTLLVLGDLNNAQRWLAYSYEVERYTPDALPSDQRALLDRGWLEVGQRLRRVPAPPALSRPGTAVATRQRPAPPAPVPEDGSTTGARAFVDP